MYAILATVMFVVTLYCAGIGSPTGEVLQRTFPGAFSAVQSGVNRYLAPWVWDQFANFVLAWPAWTVPAGLTVMFALIMVVPELTRAARRRLLATALARPGAAHGTPPPSVPHV